MPRKRLTEIFPWLLPIRNKQKKAFFYNKMKMDERQYAHTIAENKLPYLLYETGSILYNPNTGTDMKYQENKVFNLQLAAKTLDGLLIKPQETFSFWWCVKDADRTIPYKDGLIVANGKLTTVPGGGMCQMSNLLFSLFLHSPLTITERHTHHVKSFPDPTPDTPKGIDATVKEGWLDLKVTNDTEQVIQLAIAFDEEKIYGQLLVEHPVEVRYEISSQDVQYLQKNQQIYEQVAVYREAIDLKNKQCLKREHLYDNCCVIGYQLPADTLINVV